MTTIRNDGILTRTDLGALGAQAYALGVAEETANDVTCSGDTTGLTVLVQTTQALTYQHQTYDEVAAAWVTFDSTALAAGAVQRFVIDGHIRNYRGRVSAPAADGAFTVQVWARRN